jgi:hypothetical protein
MCREPQHSSRSFRVSERRDKLGVSYLLVGFVLPYLHGSRHDDPLVVVDEPRAPLQHVSLLRAFVMPAPGTSRSFRFGRAPRSERSVRVGPFLTHRRHQRAR